MIVVLEKTSGIPIALKGSKLILRKDILAIEHSTVTLDDIRPFLHDSKARFRKSNIYYIHRNVGSKSSLRLFNDNDLRYDLTVLENGKIGREFVKTRGHYHPFKQGTSSRYPEVYEVIYGRAFFVLQKIGRNEERVEKVHIVKASAREKVVVPPGYGHVTVNVGPRPLLMANLVSNIFESVYEQYKKKKGACYYILKHRGGPTPIPNSLYRGVSPPQILTPKESSIGLSKKLSLYRSAREDIRMFEWLNSPEKSKEELDIERLFQPTSLY